MNFLDRLKLTAVNVKRAAGNAVFGDLHTQVTRALQMIAELDKDGHGRNRRRTSPINSEEKHWTENAIATIACATPYPDDTPANLLERAKDEERELERHGDMVVSGAGPHFGIVRKAIDLGNMVLDRVNEGHSQLDNEAIAVIAQMAVDDPKNLTLRSFDIALRNSRQQSEHMPQQFNVSSLAR